MHESLTQLYFNTGCCEHQSIILSADGYDEIYESVMKQFQNGEISEDQLNYELYTKTGNLFKKDFMNGFGKATFGYGVPDNDLINVVQNNIFAFSGAKTFSQMKELRDAVYKDGKLVPYTQFREIALKINSKYNENYLKVERDNVIRSGTMGSKWLAMARDKDLYPYLEYKTKGDSRVRPQHEELNGITLPFDDTFWDYNYPPNDWNCRCTVKQISESNIESGKNKLANSEDAQKLAGKNITNKAFRTNVGKTGIIFSEDSAYYANMPGKQLKAFNYGLRDVKTIYDRPAKLAVRKNSLSDIEEYNNWWKEQVKRSPSVGDNSFELANSVLQTKLRFSGDLMIKLVERDRFHYAQEILTVVNNPDEVWSSYLGSKKFKPDFKTVYIKFFEDWPIVLVVNKSGDVESFYELKDSLEMLNNFRMGLLLLKK